MSIQSYGGSFLSTKMNMIVNGDIKNVDSKVISKLLIELDINPKGKVVELNGKFIHWSDYSNTYLKENDTGWVKK